MSRLVAQDLSGFIYIDGGDEYEVDTIVTGDPENEV
jgi:hypothetical protein